MKTRKSRLGNIFAHIYLMTLSVIAVFPLAWIILSSFKPQGEMLSQPTKFWPSTFSLHYYKNVIDNLGFLTNIKNSLWISLLATVIAITISTLAAYGIVRFFPRIGKKMGQLLVTTYMFPPILLAMPYTLIMAKLGLTNTHMGLVIVYLSFSVPYAVWILVGFFEKVPLEIEESASIDGANRLQVFRQIVLPIVAPGIVATAIYTFINAWNEFLYSLILINSSNKMTISVALKSLEGAEILDWGDMMAASVLVVVPSVIFFMIIQDKIVGGMTEGSIK